MMPLPDVVVILAVATWLDASCQVGDQGICLSAVAIVCRRSPTSDGLATAWPKAWQLTRGNSCVIRQPGKRRAARQAGRGPSSRPDGPDQPGPDDPTAMGTTALARREAAEVRSADYRVQPCGSRP